ncbi:superoxide dismutase family protein [Nocardiopsis sediminis]|uniref:Superoxide dismutase family protein n=1 Tax=Nocardiopsis sediminis TaxID=1778267 RepID=A0ABV8FR54_9ACTN
MPLTRTFFGLALSVLLLAGCNNGGGGGGGYDEGNDDAAEGAESDGTNREESDGTNLEELASVSATFEAADSGADALTYSEAVPEGSTIDVRVVANVAGGTDFSIRLDGLEPDRDYGAHVHTDPCGPDPDDSGPHYQNREDPEQPSTSPRFANPENEVWLDFTTDSDGAGGAQAGVTWQPREGEANSVVVHEHHTHTGPDDSGTAGDRLACVNVPL